MKWKSVFTTVNLLHGTAAPERGVITHLPEKLTSIAAVWINTSYLPFNTLKPMEYYIYSIHSCPHILGAPLWVLTELVNIKG